MPAPYTPKQNKLLADLPQGEYDRLLPLLELVPEQVQVRSDPVDGGVVPGSTDHRPGQVPPLFAVVRGASAQGDGPGIGARDEGDQEDGEDANQ